MNTPKVDMTRCVSVKKLASMNDDFPVGSLRWLIHKTRHPHLDDTDGFIECIVRKSKRRLLINLDAFERWLAKRSGAIPA